MGFILRQRLYARSVGSTALSQLHLIKEERQPSISAMQMEVVKLVLMLLYRNRFSINAPVPDLQPRERYTIAFLCHRVRTCGACCVRAMETSIFWRYENGLGKEIRSLFGNSRIRNTYTPKIEMSILVGNGCCVWGAYFGAGHEELFFLGTGSG